MLACLSYQLGVDKPHEVNSYTDSLERERIRVYLAQQRPCIGRIARLRSPPTAAQCWSGQGDPDRVSKQASRQ
jgi:hypothetical protein